ncbi:DUF445 domain-containing protein [Tuberibacillus sp. Marseille-P3662]|uniref:DUF445 domain-containing protein n=1 Tax=Tuberibacillus sp. Marseille-P3662 TaxID=1965358 RepID=UPI000A1CCF6E|nr:DUF445 family protein [Tuberibacillus sp. Marseille-P3662]
MGFFSVIGMIGVLVIAGAVIGGLTNSIAIKMLFRPYQAKYIGSWRVPFTPGLIPKRQEEIASQLGQLVMKHLLTSDSIKQKLNETDLQQTVTDSVKAKAYDWLDADEAVEQSLSKWLGGEQPVDEMVDRLESGMERIVRDWLASHRNWAVKDILPETLDTSIEQKMPEVAGVITQHIVNYLESPDGKAEVTKKLDAFLESKGMFGGMIQMFLGNQSMVDKIYPELIRFLREQGLEDVISRMLLDEWSAIKQKTIAELEEQWAYEGALEHYVLSVMDERQPVKALFAKRPSELLGNQVKDDIDQLVPRAVQMLMMRLSDRLPDLLKLLNLEDVVTRQVQQFSVQELEQVILMISKKEFKMITYLGAFIGGVIGVFQSLLIFLMN